MGGAVMYSYSRKREKGEGNGAEDNRRRTGEEWNKQEGRMGKQDERVM